MENHLCVLLREAKYDPKKMEQLISLFSCIFPLVASVVHLISCGHKKTYIGMILEPAYVPPSP